MNATLASSAAPPSAIKVWTDGLRIFAEVGGYITAFPLTEGGLSKVLNLLRERRVDYSGPPRLQRPHELTGTPIQHAHAEAVLRRMGVI